MVSKIDRRGKPQLSAVGVVGERAEVEEQLRTERIGFSLEFGVAVRVESVVIVGKVGVAMPWERVVAQLVADGEALLLIRLGPVD